MNCIKGNNKLYRRQLQLWWPLKGFAIDGLLPTTILEQPSTAEELMDQYLVLL